MSLQRSGASLFAWTAVAVAVRGGFGGCGERQIQFPPDVPGGFLSDLLCVYTLYTLWELCFWEKRRQPLQETNSPLLSASRLEPWNPASPPSCHTQYNVLSASPAPAHPCGLKLVACQISEKAYRVCRYPQIKREDVTEAVYDQYRTRLSPRRVLRSAGKVSSNSLEGDTGYCISHLVYNLTIH